MCLRGRELEDGDGVGCMDGVLNGVTMILYGLSLREGPFEVVDEKGLAIDWAKAPLRVSDRRV